MLTLSQKERDRLVYLRLVREGQLSVSEGARRAGVGRRHFRRLLRRFEASGDAVDGLHIGLATAAAVDLLVSWNFKHIVHYDKIRLFNAVHLELGYRPLQIYSPRQVTHYEEE